MKIIKDTVVTDNDKQRLERLAWFLDSAIPLPFGLRIGLDALIGLIPVIGDAVSAVISTYILAIGVKQGAPKSVVIKMISNVLLDAVLGVVPVLGDIFDIVHRANVKNVHLLKDYYDQPADVQRTSRIWLVTVILMTLCAVLGCMWLTAKIITFIFTLVF